MTSRRERYARGRREVRANSSSQISSWLKTNGFKPTYDENGDPIFMRGDVQVYVAGEYWTASKGLSLQDEGIGLRALITFMRGNKLLSQRSVKTSAVADLTKLYSMATRLKQGLQSISSSTAVQRLLGDADIALTKQVIPKIALAVKKAGESQ